MKKFISVIISFILLSSLVISVFAGNKEVLEDSFVSDFDLTNEEVLEIVKLFKVNPRDKQMALGYNIYLSEDEYNYYFYNRIDEFCIRCGYKNSDAILHRFISRPNKYDVIFDGTTETRYDVYVEPENNGLEGLDYVYYTAKMIYAAGYSGKYNSNPFNANYPCVRYIGGVGDDYFETAFMYDINYDGVFNAKDSLALRKYLVGSSYRLNSEAADQNKDSKINLKDLYLLKAELVK